MNGTKKMIAGLVSAFSLIGIAQAATIDVTSSIGASTKWFSTNEYVLLDVIFVTNGATLTIEPGTVIRGETYANAGDKPTALFITRGSKIMAQGTKKKPIIFTDMDDNNFPWVDPANVLNDYKTINPTAGLPDKSKLWGGLVVCGKAYCTVNAAANVGPLVETEKLAEGLADPGQGQTKYGGSDDDDSSGVISYVSLRYGGYGFASASEINGITLCGVGRGTKIDHVEVIGNLDDGIEFFGGTVNTKNIAIVNIGDDSFDVDQGYRGRGQFIFVMQGFCDADAPAGSGLANHAFEMDGVELSDDNRPWGLQRYENVTVIGNRYRGTGGTGTSGSETSSECFHLDDNCRAQFFNCIVMDVDSMLAAVESDNAKPDSFEGMSAVWNAFPTHTPGAGALANTGYYYQSQSTNATQTAFRNFVVYNCNNAHLICKTTSANAKRAGGDVTIEAAWDWNLTGTMPIRHMEREALSDPARPMPAAGNGLLNNIKTIDPRPVSAWATSPYATEDDGFATPVSYYGAFAPTGDTWLDGWSALYTSGMLVKNGGADLEIDQAAFSVGFDAEVGMTYTLFASINSGTTWTQVAGAEAVVADKTNMTLADFGVTSVASKIYKVVAE
jgi:hypothetical protein